MRRHVRSLRSLPVIVGIAVWVSSGQAPAQAADSIIGTWTLNVTKSTYSPGPPPKSLTVKIEAAGDGIKSTADTVAADVMTTEIVSVPPDATVASVARTLREQAVHRVLVIDDGELLGLISAMDLVALLEREQ